jgi:hypothetical protein
MQLPRLLLGAALCAALLCAGTPGFAGEVCDGGAASGSGPVSLLILKSDAQVHELARALARGVPVVSRDAGTVVFRDGRVITADVGGVDRHLNALGWSQRNIEIVASFGTTKARPRRARG